MEIRRMQSNFYIRISRNIHQEPGEYSILASTLAYIYKITGEKEKYKRYLVASAISDVRGAVKRKTCHSGDGYNHV